MRNIAALICMLFLAGAATAQASRSEQPKQGQLPKFEGNLWRGIVPLKTTKAEVEKLLGSPTDPKNGGYETENELVAVHFSTGHCGGRYEYWNVPEGIVTNVAVAPKQPVDGEKAIEEYGSAFQLSPQQHAMPKIRYQNHDDSVFFWVATKSDGTLNFGYIGFKPSTAQWYDRSLRSLRCPSR